MFITISGSCIQLPFAGCMTDGNVYSPLPRLRGQELCESRGGRPGLSVLMSVTVSVDVKQH